MIRGFITGADISFGYWDSDGVRKISGYEN